MTKPTIPTTAPADFDPRTPDEVLSDLHDRAEDRFDRDAFEAWVAARLDENPEFFV